MTKASISVFLGLTLSLVMSLFFSMAEVIRYAALEKEAVSLCYSAVQSAFGEYNRPLWQDYGILALDTDYGGNYEQMQGFEDTISYYIEKDFVYEDGNVDFLHLDVSDVTSKDLVFLTDMDGTPFIREAVKTVKSELTEDALQTLLGDCDECLNASQNSVDVESVLSDTQEALTRSEEEEETTRTSGEGQNEAISLQKYSTDKKMSEMNRTDAVVEESQKSAEDTSFDFIEEIKNLESKGVLSQVMTDETNLSNQAFVTEENVSNRQLLEGTGSISSVTAVERTLFQYYLVKHFSCYGEKKHEAGMDYELEYVLCGCSSDKENLVKTVECLLAVREVENLISISMDSHKVSEVKAMAAAASTVILHPELEELISYGIMAAWAYVESVLDVRLLLRGGKVPLMKTSAEWTSDIREIHRYFDTEIKAKDCEKGISYKGYLFALLTLKNQKEIAFRSLDLMEESLHQNKDYSGAKLDHFLVEASLEVSTKAMPIFLPFIPLYQADFSNYEFVVKRRMSYL